MEDYVITPPASTTQSLLLFRIDGQHYALSLMAVERIIRAAAVTPVPETPPFVHGVLNLGGHILSVVSLRRCLGLAGRDIQPEDQFVIARTSRISVALVVDEVQGLGSFDAARAVPPGDVVPGQGSRVRCMLRTDDGIVLVYDLDALFSMDDQSRMQACQEFSLGANIIHNERS